MNTYDNPYSPPDSVQEALLFCDYWGRFGAPEFRQNFRGISDVIRGLTRRIEEQAMALERLEASRENPS